MVFSHKHGAPGLFVGRRTSPLEQVFARCLFLGGVEPTRSALRASNRLGTIKIWVYEVGDVNTRNKCCKIRILYHSHWVLVQNALISGLADPTWYVVHPFSSRANQIRRVPGGWSKRMSPVPSEGMALPSFLWLDSLGRRQLLSYGLSGARELGVRFELRARLVGHVAPVSRSRRLGIKASPVLGAKGREVDSLVASLAKRSWLLTRCVLEKRPESLVEPELLCFSSHSPTHQTYNRASLCFPFSLESSLTFSGHV